MNFIDYRLFFSKKNRAKYISHLDFMRAFERMLARTKLPIWWTEGFNPHIYQTFALPLSVGIAGEYESVDFRLTSSLEPALIRVKIAENLPPDIEALRVDFPKFKATEIARAEYEFECEDIPLVETVFSQDKLIVERKTKKGVSFFDLKEQLSDIKWRQANILIVTLPTGGTLNINPRLLGTEIGAKNITRTKIFTKTGAIFS